MKFLTLFFFLLESFVTNAQTPTANYGKVTRNDWGSIMRGSQPMMTKKSENTELRGSPFIFDTYEKGIIIVSDSLQSESDFTFKVNAEDNEIWTSQKNKGEIILTDKRITGLDLIVAGDTHVFRKALLPDVKKNPLRFVEVLFKGTHFTLIKSTDKIFEAANYEDKGLTSVGRNYDNYTTVTTYYILNQKKVFKKIALRKGDIYKGNLALVEKNRDAINKFCKDNQIANPLEEADAIELLEYLDKLE